MEEQMRLRYMRRTFSTQGVALLVYYLIMNAAVALVMLGDSLYLVFSGGVELDTDSLTDHLLNSSGWGYFLAIAIGGLVLLLWKKPEFCFGTVWTRGKPMTVGSFFGILSIFVSGQLVFQLLIMAMELVFNSFGGSVADLLESSSVSTDGLSLFLYVGLGAPISEEILFRGLVLRSAEPFGKKFAIFASALLFGLFHGNLVQAPYAFVVGLVLGYVTLEYSIGWAMVLHMFNNLILSDTLVRLTADWPYPVGDMFLWVLIIGFSVAALGVVIVKRKNIAAYFRREYNDPLCAKAFFTAPGVIAVMVILAASILFSTVSALLI